MDEKNVVEEILNSYSEIEVERVISEKIILFKLFGIHFVLLAPDSQNLWARSMILLRNDDELNCPHIMLREEEYKDDSFLPAGQYRYVCLYENDSIVNSLITFEEKITDALDRLIDLLTMNKVRREIEFQKEFMYYWNSCTTSKGKYSIYLSSNEAFSELNIYYGAKEIRVVEKELILSDLNATENKKQKWTQHFENNAFYIPIIDNREIIPPHKGFAWSQKEIQRILYDTQIEHLAEAIFDKIKTTIVNTQSIIIVWGMSIERRRVAFASKILFKHVQKDTLFNKLMNDISTIEPLHTKQKDYHYLCKQIGNDSTLQEKKVLIVGAGSLGSYVAFELVKNGASSIKIYDEDELEEENILRWAYGGIGIGWKKATTVKSLLEYLHPQIQVEAHNIDIDSKTLIKEVSESDMIIFTIGNSDSQLRFNSVLKQANCSIPVIYAWLEAGGIHSHMLVLDYQKPGCYECLYTNDNGEKVNNRASKSETIYENSIVHNGCGGTRAAYGTSILLRTTAAIMDMINQYWEGKITKNLLIDITPESVSVSDTIFPTEGCKCCGNKER